MIIVDCDDDGFTSASMFYRFLKKHYPTMDIDYFIHSEKQHGFTDTELMDWLTEGLHYDLIIVPDGGTNETK